MRTYRSAFIACLTWIMMTGQTLASAYEGGTWQITKVFVASTAILVNFSPAPAFCQGGSYFGRAHAQILMTADNKDELYAMVLTAHTSGKTISGIWYDNGPASTFVAPCSNSPTNLPDITGLETSD